MIRLQVIDPDSHFSCGSCTACCDQPWRTQIEAEKAAALDRHDFSKYPQLAGKKFYRSAADGREGFFDLAKGEGTRCLFLGTDNLCIIHKEMGPAAKPSMCRQFPYLSSRTWVDERISANFGCPSVQKRTGKPLVEQSHDITTTVPLSGKNAEPNRRIPLNRTQWLTRSEFDAFLDAALSILDESKPVDLWSRFDALLNLVESLTSSDASTEIISGSFEHPSKAPLAARMLFAATLQPDTIPADLVGKAGLVTRLLFIPRLMSLAQLTGGYASRLLARNVSIRDILTHPLEPGLDPDSTRLLTRYFRARLWQQTLIGTRLPIAAGVHQHIHDFNAILFYARALAQQQNAPRLTEPHIRKALTLVEFHLANQTRLYDLRLKGWFRTQLCDLSLARASLGLMSPWANSVSFATSPDR